MTGADEIWINEHTPVSLHLSTVLGVATRLDTAKRFKLLYALAEQLDLKVDLLGEDAFVVLDGLLPGLESVLAEGPGHWTSDITQERPLRVAEGATAQITLDEAVGALVQFGWPEVRLRVDNVSEIRPAVVEALNRRLADRVRLMIDQWRVQEAWRSEVKRGLTSLRQPAARPRRR